MATRLPSGSYRAQVLIGIEKGKRIYKSFTAETANAADLAALQYKAAHKEEKSARSFSTAAEEYLNNVSKTLSPTTIHGYSATLRMLKKNHKKFCKIGISLIDRAVLQPLLNEVSADHTPKTVRNYYGFISSVLRANGITPPECTMPKRKKPQFNIPDDAALERLFEAVKGTELEVPTLLGALVPMREGEILGTDISDLSSDNVLHIHNSMAVDDDGKVLIKGPKTQESDRYVKIPDKVADKIREQGYICNIGIKQFSRKFSNALNKAGIKHFRFHDLRHAFVSITHAAGIPDAYIMARGGWSTPHTMNNVYRHILDADREKMETAINDTFSKLL